MTDRRTFLRNLSLLTLGGLASQKLTASNALSTPAIDATSAATGIEAKKKMGLQTYSLGQELLRDLPNGLSRLAKMGYTDLEIFGYQEKTGQFGDYNPKNTTFVSAKDYKKMADDAGLRISSSHLTPSVREYTKENMSQFEDFWKKATDIHAELGVSYMVQPSLPRIENEDDAKRVCEIFNRAGEIAKAAGILWGYHNHNNEFKRVLKPGEKPDPNPWAPPKGTYIEELFIKNTDPDKVMFELDVYWTVMGQQDPLEWMGNYPDRIKLLHIKDRWILGDSGMMNFPNIFKKAYEIGILGYYVELEGDPKGRTQFEGVEKSAAYLQNADFVR
ncbi:MAG TPA: sugar phosphate isomerase/epimerase [Candidatus Parabacteroides intestinigallinarum]|uniref:Sugar phosphate isomerase/epimerase n=1 Tax=Candidatus Parabacteroides intestinigallinarum TaxID=2838722 RepID=A0A9D2BP22_9BACT|nr:sugar phosphate isomerase/epimerase [Candidatus Parabacteroides intestinigallinarum]